MRIARALVVLSVCAGLPAQAQGDAARALQDPLAAISAIITDNTINLDQGDNNDTGYDFQIQPVYSVPTDLGFSFVPRGVIPIIGAPPGSVFPELGEPRPSGDGTTWGLGDIILQGFFAPTTESRLKWGLGPQLSLRTRSKDATGGPGWGGGVAGVVVYSEGPLSTAGIVNHLWGEDGFSITSINPIAYYNFPDGNGWFVAYNNTVTYDWAVDSGTRWTVPIGLTVGKGIPLDGGYALELSLGGYHVPVAPEGGPRNQIKFGISMVLPRS